MRKNLISKLTTFLIFALFAGFTGCNTEDVDFKSPNVEAPDKVEINKDGTAQVVEIKANRDWAISIVGETKAEDRWISFSPESGTGDAKVTIKALPNEGKKRSVQLKVSSAIAYTYIMVTQDAAEGYDGEKIYYENNGLTIGDPIAVNDYKGWIRQGADGFDQKEVIYSGNGLVRTSGKNYEPDGNIASGAPYVYLGVADANMMISNINIASKSNFTFSFAISFQEKYDGGPVWGIITPDLFKLQASVDGVNWTQLVYTNSSAAAKWLIVSSEFKTVADAEKLYVKISDFKFTSGNQFRLDDFTLETGGHGTIVVGEPVTETKVTTLPATDVADVSAKLEGYYVKPEGTNITEAGFEYKVEGGDYTKVAATSAVSPFIVSLSGLTASTKYIYRAYAIVEAQTDPVYGEELNFTTKGGPVSAAIYFEKVGTAVEKVNNQWPYVDKFTGWSREGSLSQTQVTYSGTGANVSNSGAAYQPAAGSTFTGAPYVGMSYSAAAPLRIFQIEKINITGKTNFTFNFSSLFQSAYSGIPKFDPVTTSLFELSGSLDGTNWTDLTYTVEADPAGGNWYGCTSMFKAPEGSTSLYIKIATSTLKVGQGTRVDDFTLVEGGTGTVVIGGGTPAVLTVTTGGAADVTENSATLEASFTNPESKTITEVGFELKKDGGTYTAFKNQSVVTPYTVQVDGLVASTKYVYRAYAKVQGQTDAVYGNELNFTTNSAPVTDALYFEKTGNTVSKIGSNWPFVDLFTGWSRQGTLTQTAITYSGQDASVRDNGDSFEPISGETSGAPYVFIGKAGSFYQIGQINITGKTNFTFKMGVSYQSSYTSGPVFGAVTSSSFKLQGSVDGTNWTDLTYTNDSGVARWVIITSEFKTVAGNNTLYLKMSDFSQASAYRLDDFKLVEGGTGTIVIGGGGGATAVTAGDATDITTSTAKVAGTYTLESGKTATAAGIEYKISGSELDYTSVNATPFTSPFTVDLADLVENTKYVYRAFVTVDGNKIYSTGADRTFTTQAAVLTNKTIKEVLDAFDEGQPVTSGWKIAGVVVSDKAGGNFVSQEAFAIMDNTAGMSVLLPSPTANTFVVGDKLEIDLSGSQYINFNGVLEVVMSDVTKISKVGTETPTPVTISNPTQTELQNNLSKLVTITGAQAMVTTGTMGGTKKFVASSTEFDVFTKTAAVFKNDVVPTGKGSITGVVSVYNGNYQLQPRFAADFEGMTGNRDGSIVFDVPEFQPLSLKEGAAFTDGKIIITYNNNPSATTATVSVASSIGGITGITNQSVNLVQGSGTVTLQPIAGTPATAGTATFTITGLTGLTANTVDVTVQPAGAAGGGTADFNSVATNTGYTTRTTTDGWVINNAAVLSGGSKDVTPVFSFIDSSDATIAMCIKGNTQAVGVITSPLLTGGCGVLSFKYGLPFSDRNGVSVKIEIKQNDVVVKELTLTKTGSEMSQKTAYLLQEDINVAGDFTIVITNMSPSKSSADKAVDRTAIWNLEWTGKQ